MNALEKARLYASAAHAGQKYGRKQFTYHLRCVELVAREFDLSEEVRIAAWLHDIIEDTPVTYTDIRELFGKFIAELVYAVTDELGRNRAERKRKTLLKVAECEYEGALALKLCDRIANMRVSVDEDRGHYRMYLKEATAFKEILYKEGELEELWAALGELT